MKFKIAIITLTLALFLIPTVSSAQVRDSHLEQQLRTIELLLSQLRSRLGVSVGDIVIPRGIVTRTPDQDIDPLFIRITGPRELDRNERGEWRVRTEGDGDLELHIDWDDGDDTEEEVEDRDTEEFTHRYDSRGTYDIVFTLTNDQGRRVSETMTVRVDNGRNNRNDDDIEEVQITITNNRARVRVELENGKTESFTLHTDDKDDIIEEIARRYNEDEDDIEDMIEWDDEDDNDNDNNDIRIASIDPGNGEEGDIVELEIRDIDEDDADEIEVFFNRQRLSSSRWDIEFRSGDRATIEFEVPDVREDEYDVWIEVDRRRSNRVSFEVED